MPKPIRFAISLTFIGVFISLLAGFAVFKSYSQGNVDGISVEPTQSVTVVTHMMSGGPISNTSCVVPPSKSIFTLTDERAYQWTSFSGISAGDVVRRDFIRPDGTIHFTSPDRFPSSGSSCAWDSIPIAGDQAALFPGNWQARVYYNGALILTENFTISDRQPTTGAAVIIDGTDANEHGGVSGGANVRGWLYMQKALENLAARVDPGTAKVVVDLGSSSGTARNAINSAFNLSSLPGAGWQLRHEDGAANITNWLTNISTANTGILYITTYNLTGGDLDAQEMAAINAQAGRIAGFMSLSPGGALFAMGEVGAGSWDWLRALYSGIVVTDVGGGGISSNITLTPDGTTSFPGLTNTDLAGADPWHNYFTGNLGDLKVLATAPQSGATRQVILGGLGIRPNPSPRVVRIVCPPSASLGGALILPIELVSEGNENALGFSLNFDPTVLGDPRVATGADANNATLNVNSSQIAQGRLGVGLSLPSGQAFAVGVRRIAVVTFTVSATTTATSTTVDFGDAPIRKEVSNANAQILIADYQGCPNIIIDSEGYEADVAPRPNGNNNGAVTITDWVQVGRFSAALDTAAAGSEFKRADCAPRETKGNGQLSITDWVQAGRYAAGLDADTEISSASAASSSVKPPKYFNSTIFAWRGWSPSSFCRT